MQNQVFNAATFDEARNIVVCQCNGYATEERWTKESPLIASAILSHLPEGASTVLDYGCGPGRLAREIIKMRSDVSVIGVDTSRDFLGMAKIYVNDERFKPLLPQQLNEPVDLAYAIFVLQHIPAIELRDALARMHHYLKPGGILCDCSTPWRLAVRFDQRGFLDDRILGVDLEKEVLRFFEPVGPLFSEQMLQEQPMIRSLVKGENKDSSKGVPHRAMVYRRREVSGLYFNVP